MPLFYRSELERAAGIKSLAINKSAEAILSESMKTATKELKQYDIFLSHRYMDAKYILGLKSVLEELDYSVFVDWIERPELDRSRVNRDVAQWLRQMMRRCSCLLYAASNNSSESKWMPWELGYSDGIHGRVAIVPIVDTSTSANPLAGQEYLGLYPYITKSTIANTNTLDVWVHDSPEKYVRMKYWLTGTNPSKH